MNTGSLAGWVYSCALAGSVSPSQRGSRGFGAHHAGSGVLSEGIDELDGDVAAPAHRHLRGHPCLRLVVVPHPRALRARSRSRSIRDGECRAAPRVAWAFIRQWFSWSVCTFAEQTRTSEGVGGNRDGPAGAGTIIAGYGAGEARTFSYAAIGADSARSLLPSGLGEPGAASPPAVRDCSDQRRSRLLRVAPLTRPPFPGHTHTSHETTHPL